MGSQTGTQTAALGFGGYQLVDIFSKQKNIMDLIGLRWKFKYCKKFFSRCRNKTAALAFGGQFPPQK
jgi:hypothetical protein